MSGRDFKCLRAEGQHVMASLSLQVWAYFVDGLIHALHACKYSAASFLRDRSSFEIKHFWKSQREDLMHVLKVFSQDKHESFYLCMLEH